MSETHFQKIAREQNIGMHQVKAVAELIEDGSTVPFIARYRKEMTGSLDEVVIIAIRTRLQQLAELDSRRESILKSLEERELLTDKLKTSIDRAETLSELEDVYLPFRPKRRTRAIIAKEKGLEPLAEKIFEQGPSDPLVEAAQFVDGEKVGSVEEALAGARDIIAEFVSEHANARAMMRSLFLQKGNIRSKVVTGKEVEGAKFRDYFDAGESVTSAPSHRVLAVFRGEKEGVLSLSIRPAEEEALGTLKRFFLKKRNQCAAQVETALEDGYKRLLGPSMETEVRGELKNRADEEAIRVFASNLRELLIAAPLGRKRVLALDPGFRTGCKLVCLDSEGKLLHHDVIFPTTSERAQVDAASKMKAYVSKFDIQAIAIGNGTAGRETEAFVRSLDLPKSVIVVMVNESGASVYSASKTAREEFPDQDVTVRGAVSIGRRLMDPLSELVKIDPKAIGVGQYQHDVDQGALKKGLDDVVISCVNSVGVEVNTAGKELLTYVSGLGPTLAKNIVAWRDANGPFASRSQLLKVPRLGPKAFQQAAGFLRIRDGKNPLDGSAVHPESYDIVKKMALDLGSKVPDLMKSDDLRKQIKLNQYVSDVVGMPTLLDIVQELAKPGRDPRQQFEVFSFAESVNSIEDLRPGMKLPGIVTNVTKFGAFVDIGVHQDGLVHISELADRYVTDPGEIVKAQQRVEVTVLEIDAARKRISLSMRGKPVIKK
jgi:protein Tex